MYVLLYPLGVILVTAALVTLIASGFLVFDRIGWAIAAIVFTLIAFPAGVLSIRQGSWLYAERECAGISTANPNLDVNRVQVTFWDFGCYVTLDDEVTIPWNRYRAVVDG